MELLPNISRLAIAASEHAALAVANRHDDKIADALWRIAETAKDLEHALSAGGPAVELIEEVMGGMVV